MRIQKSILLFITFLDLVFASEPVAHARTEVKSQSQTTLVLEGDSCEEISHEVAALVQWKMKLDGGAPVTGECTIQGNGRFEQDVSNLLPKRVQDVNQVATKRNGPNCLGTAMYVNGFTPHWNFQFDALQFMQGCKKLKAPAKPQTGDIILIYTQGVNEEEVAPAHGLTYLTDNLIFAKPGYRGHEVPRFTALANDMNGEQNSTRCLTTNAIYDKELCKEYGVVYRCGAPVPVRPHLRPLYDAVSATEQEIERLNRTADSLTNEQYNFYKQEYQKHLNRAIELQGSASTARNSVVYQNQVRELWARAVSLMRQVEMPGWFL